MSIVGSLVYRVSWEEWKLVKVGGQACEYPLCNGFADPISDDFGTFNEAVEWAQLAARCSPCVFENGCIIRRKFYINAFRISEDCVDICNSDGSAADPPTLNDCCIIDALEYSPEILDEFIDYY